MDEHQLQIQCFNWFRYNVENQGKGYIFATPNASKRTMAMARYMTAEGMRAGVADLVVLFPNKTIFIELKTPDVYAMNYRTGNMNKKAGGKQKPTQKEFQDTVEALGYEYHLIDNLCDFMQVITTNKQQ